MQTQTNNVNLTGAMPIPMAVAPKLSTGDNLGFAQAAIDECVAEGIAASTPAPKKDREYYRTQMKLRWNQAYKAIMGVCHLIVDARLNLTAEEWKAFVEEDCPFDYSVLQKFMKMASHPTLNDPGNEQYLPNSWTALYEVMQMKETTFRLGVQKGIIHANCTLAELKNLRSKLDPPKRKTAKPTGTEKADAKAKGTSAKAPKESTKASSDARPEPEAHPKPESEKAAVKAPVNISGYRAEKASSTATGTAPALAPQKGRITIVLKGEIVEQHRDDVNRLKERIETIVAEFSFIGSVELEEAA